MLHEANQGSVEEIIHLAKRDQAYIKICIVYKYIYIISYLEHPKRRLLFPTKY